MASVTPVPGHIPVMGKEVISCLNPQAGETHVDATFGAGGYSRAALDAAAINLIGIDRDPDAALRADPFIKAYKGRFAFRAGCFGDMAKLLADIDVPHVHGVMLDIGVSSFQLDQANRGFSFQSDGPLDMRMGGNGQTAADVVNTASEARLADIFYQYGEERESRRIAAAIVHDRVSQGFTTTRQLASLLERLSRKPRKAQSIHPATRVFQALRIFVNDELGELRRGLQAAEQLLLAGGRLVVVTFHSLEDRIVKQFFARRSGGEAQGSRHLPQAQSRAASFDVPRRSGLKPTPGECDQNPRARSARLRWGVRTAAAPWPAEPITEGIAP